jgi:hypothetical protein
MKKFLTLTLISVIIGFGLSSCKKYEEGPGLSLRSKTKRLAKTWKLQSATDKTAGVGVDVTDQFLGADLDKVYTYKFDENGGFLVNNNGVETEGEWKFDDKKENIEILKGQSVMPEIYEIIKLKNEELWLKQTVATQKTEYHFIP